MWLRTKTCGGRGLAVIRDEILDVEVGWENKREVSMAVSKRSEHGIGLICRT